MGHEVFISHAASNKVIADAMLEKLEDAGIKCWMAPRDIRPGDTWGGAILRAISASKIMIVLFSGKSNKSHQVLREVERAVQKDIVLLPFRIEDVAPTVDMEYFLSATQWLDAIDDDLDSHLEKLVETASNILAQQSGDTVVEFDDLEPSDSVLELESEFELDRSFTEDNPDSEEPSEPLYEQENLVDQDAPEPETPIEAASRSAVDPESAVNQVTITETETGNDRPDNRGRIAPDLTANLSSGANTAQSESITQRKEPTWDLSVDTQESHDSSIDEAEVTQEVNEEGTESSLDAKLSDDDSSKHRPTKITAVNTNSLETKPLQTSPIETESAETKLAATAPLKAGSTGKTNCAPKAASTTKNSRLILAASLLGVLSIAACYFYFASQQKPVGPQTETHSNAVDKATARVPAQPVKAQTDPLNSEPDETNLSGVDSSPAQADLSSDENVGINPNAAAELITQAEEAEAAERAVAVQRAAAEKERERALELAALKQRAKSGDTNAQLELGLMYNSGAGVAQNFSKAKDWFAVAAEQGNANAQFSLGEIYLKGNGTKQDAKLALEWLNAAAEQKNAAAQNLLGRIFEDGEQVERDYTIAAGWYALAAEQGNSNAQRSLGVLNEFALGVPRNYQNALKWYALAAEQGDSKAQLYWEQLSGKLNEQSEAEAQ